MNLIEDCQDLIIIYSYVLITFMGSRQKFDLEHVGFEKIHLWCLVCHSLNSKEWLLIQSNISYILGKAASFEVYDFSCSHNLFTPSQEIFT